MMERKGKAERLANPEFKMAAVLMADFAFFFKDRSTKLARAKKSSVLGQIVSISGYVLKKRA